MQEMKQNKSTIRKIYVYVSGFLKGTAFCKGVIY